MARVNRFFAMARMNRAKAVRARLPAPTNVRHWYFMYDRHLRKPIYDLAALCSVYGSYAGAKAWSDRIDAFGKEVHNEFTGLAQVIEDQSEKLSSIQEDLGSLKSAMEEPEPEPEPEPETNGGFRAWLCRWFW